MSQYGKNEGCLSQELLVNLAIRLTSEGGAIIAPSEGSQAELPADLFLSGEEDARTHLSTCNACKIRLLAEIHQYEQYLKSVVTGEETRFMHTAEEADESFIQTEIIELRYLPYPSRETTGALAADTDGAGSSLLRFASPDRKILLREITDSNRNKRLLCIDGDLPAEYHKLFLTIDDTIYRINEEGCITLDTSLDKISPTSKILLHVE